MMTKKPYTLQFKDIKYKDVNVVGGKVASLGEMFSNLTTLGINVPDGFSVTAHAFEYFFESAGIKGKINDILEDLDAKNIFQLKKKSAMVRKLILAASIPKDLESEILNSYKWLSEKYGRNTDVAVRSSAAFEDMPDASFAGQQDTYLNIKGNKELLLAVKKVAASMFNDRAIS